MRRSWRDDSGQTMIVVALAAVVLLGAVALAVDWGFGLTQRRVMQASSDAAALAVGRYLATSVIEVDGETVFIVSQADACAVAEGYAVANRSFAPPAGTHQFTLQLGSGDPIVWTDVTTTGSCASASPTVVPADVRYVRVTSSVTYHSLVSGVIGFPTTRAAASARAKIFGSATPARGPIWPMVRHYDADDFNMPCVGGAAGCDPMEIQPFTFWSPNEANVVYGNFKGMIDMSRDSSRLSPTPVQQLVAGWDASGSAAAEPPTPLKPDVSGNCSSGWDTKGGEDPQNANKQCSIPNWFYYSFQGEVSLTSDWSAAGGKLPSGQEAPDTLTARSVCSDAERPVTAPSCAGASPIGDWVEIAGGNVGSNESAAMLQRIREEGSLNAPFSDRPVDPKKPDGQKFGKGLVVLIYLWDCAESYSSTDPDGDRWDLIVPERGPGRGDCSQLGRTGNDPTPDRVHLFTAAPFTFYENLVSSQEIRGFWGGAWGTSIDCAAWAGGEPMCAMNPLANSAILIADDDYSGP